ncbi:MAG: hypothetical protein ACXQTM_06450, partial [Methanosarcinales archaeon]
MNINNFGINNFGRFLTLHKNLSDRTVQDHIAKVKAYIESGLSIEDFLMQIKESKTTSTYRNYLGAMKVFFRDYLKQPEAVQDFKFPRKQVKPKILPSKAELKVFYDALPQTKYKAIFLLLASSGLRIGELLNSKIDTGNRMTIPHPSHTSSTKKLGSLFSSFS